MSIRCLFLAEGTSDQGLVGHIERFGASQGVALNITAPDLARLPRPTVSVGDKISSTVHEAGEYDLIFVHRDADRFTRTKRLQEIAAAVRKNGHGHAHVAVVPLRMTEAWLLLDETAVRQVAGNPRGTMSLDLPSPRKVEAVADPKARLRDALVTASNLRGRRLEQFKRDFGHHRRQLLEMLDHAGPVREVPSWQHFVMDTTTALESCP